MLDVLKTKNPDLTVVSVEDPLFSTYGRICKGVDIEPFLEAVGKIGNPATGSSYVATEPGFETLDASNVIKREYFGSLPTQVGYCWGHNTKMNATEWHMCSEINIAITPLVLLLAHVWEVEENQIDSGAFRAFYVPAGTVLEVYATTLHFCPCQVTDEGFGCVVALPQGTNLPFAEEEGGLLFKQNKWLLAHVENRDLIARGAVAGITGKNFEIRY